MWCEKNILIYPWLCTEVRIDNEIVAVTDDFKEAVKIVIDKLCCEKCTENCLYNLIDKNTL